MWARKKKKLNSTGRTGRTEGTGERREKKSGRERRSKLETGHKAWVHVQRECRGVKHIHARGQTLHTEPDEEERKKREKKKGKKLS